MPWFACYFLLLSLLIPAVTAFSPFQWVKDTLKHEHCGSVWIEPDIRGLEQDLLSKVYGQHLVSDVVLKLVSSHLMSEHQPAKALVLSFHGWTGVGKNYVSTMIAKRLYQRAMDSKFVKLFIATRNFPFASDVNSYKARLQEVISATVAECGQSLFIFDEVDKMPEGVLDAIKPFLDYHSHVDGVDYRRAVFIFLSNNGGNAIAEFTLNHWQSGQRRDDIKLKNVESLLMKHVFNEKGGLKYSTVIDKNLVSAFVPFLPLERQHVKMCIKDNARTKNFFPDEELTNDVADELEYFPADSPFFSSSGCKRIDEKVNLHQPRRNRRDDL